MKRQPMNLSCATCGREVRTQVYRDDRDDWPLHRCLGGRAAPFTDGEPFDTRVLQGDLLRYDLTPAGAGVRLPKMPTTEGATL